MKYSKITYSILTCTALCSVLAVPDVFASTNTPSSSSGTPLVDHAMIANSFPLPPANFNPLKASNTQLAKYGFPKRPTDPKQLVQWQDVMSHFKQMVKPKYLPPNGYWTIPQTLKKQSTAQNGTTIDATNPI